jgi:polygalacturonase
LKSNINLHVEEGAFIIFSKDKADYPLVDVSFEGLNTTVANHQFLLRTQPILPSLEKV